MNESINLKKIGVFCGASIGKDEKYAFAAQQLAQTLVQQNMALVYGGAKVGVMGELANAMLQLGGEAIGVMTQHLLDKEIVHTDLSQLHIVGTMHERKALMAELADGFILFPGGAGSLDEFFEVMTWAQLGFHQKPCGILNVNSYFDHLLKFLDHAVMEQFVRPAHRNMLIVKESPQELLDAFACYQKPSEVRWVKV